MSVRSDASLKNISTYPPHSSKDTHIYDVLQSHHKVRLRQVLQPSSYAVGAMGQ